MPVQRFRSFDEARRALWVESGDPSLARRIAGLWRLSARLVSRRIPRGVRKFHTIEDANREREVWVSARVEALLAERASD